MASSGKALVQYIILRGDLKWSKGALVAQACHACSAVIHNTYNSEETRNYLSDLDNMHKVILKCDDRQSLTDLAENLTDNGIQHKLWIEQPENIETCLAIQPIVKERVFEFVQHFKLFR